MKLPLPYVSLAAHWTPGFITLCFILFPFMKHYWNPNLSTGVAAILIFFFTVFSFLVGQIIDSFRSSILETIFNRYCTKINWIAFAMNDNDKIDNLYFVYYIFDINLILSTIIGVTSIFFSYYDFLSNYYKAWVIFISFITMIFFLVDAIDLRKEMSEIIARK